MSEVPRITANFVRLDKGIVLDGTDKIGKEIQDSGPGKHLWIVACAYRIFDPLASFEDRGNICMDLENMLTIEGPACYKCELSWNPSDNTSFCEGHMPTEEDL